MKTYRIANAYDLRETLRRIGGVWLPALKAWKLTEDQMADLRSRAAESEQRSNKRDRAIFIGLEKATVTEIES